MALMPKRVKFRKSQKGRVRGNATRGNYVAFGEYGLQALEPGGSAPRPSRPVASSPARRSRGEASFTSAIFPQKSVTAIPAETRMGKGKGEVEFWAAVVKPGTILYEISGLSEEVARETFARVAHKMPVSCRFVSRRPTI